MKEFITILMLLLPLCRAFAVADEDGIRENLSKAAQYLSKDPSRSVLYSKNALEDAMAIKSTALMARAQAMIADSYINLGEYVSSFEYLLEAERNCPREDRALQGEIQLGISYSYMKVKDFDNAFLYLDKAQEVFTALGDTAAVARCENNRGLICISIPDNGRAARHFSESLRLNRATGNLTGIAQNLNNMSFLDDDPQETIERLEEAVRINESLGRTWILGENYNNLGYQYGRAGNPEAALSALAKARSYALQTNARELLMDNLRYRSEIYAQTGRYGLAYEDIKSLLDGIESRDMSGDLKDIEVSLMKKNIDSIRKEKEREEKEYKLRWEVAILLIALMAAVCTIIIVSYNLYRKASLRQVEVLQAQKKIDSQDKELMRKELDFNKKELGNFALFIKSRNELMAGIQKKIREIYGMESAEATRQLKKLNSSIAQFNRNNDEAEKMIDQVNSSFIMKLSDSHPDLSNSDKRLASLLRIGMTSKEISLIMLMEPKSVDMARYRLRRKLNLHPSENLCDYLGRI